MFELGNRRFRSYGMYELIILHSNHLVVRFQVLSLLFFDINRIRCFGEVSLKYGDSCLKLDLVHLRTARNRYLCIEGFSELLFSLLHCLDSFT